MLGECVERAINIRTDGHGIITHMSMGTAMEVLERPYRRNWDPGSPDFQSPTDVQSRALYTVLTQRGAHGLGKASSGIRLGLLPSPADMEATDA